MPLDLRFVMSQDGCGFLIPVCGFAAALVSPLSSAAGMSAAHAIGMLIQPKQSCGTPQNQNLTCFAPALLSACAAGLWG